MPGFFVDNVSRPLPMVGTDQLMLDFKTFAGLHEPVLVIERFVIAKRSRMDLVDRDMNVQVFGVQMDRRYALVLSHTDRGDEGIFDVTQLFRRGTLPGRKRHDHVIVFILLAPRVLGLSQQNLERGVRRIVGRAVGNPDTADLGPVVFGIEYVVGCTGPRRRVDAALGVDDVARRRPKFPCAMSFRGSTRLAIICGPAPMLRSEAPPPTLGYRSKPDLLERDRRPAPVFGEPKLE